MAAILEVKNLKTQYKLAEGDLIACDDISITLNKGERLGLVGESACGKSSFALSLLNLLPDNGKIVNGTVLLDGRDISKLSQEEIRQIRWKDISIIFQGAMNALNPVRTVGEQIVECIQIHETVSVKEAWRRASDLFQKVEIDPTRIRQYPHEFSGGMRQRVMIAMAIACNPKVVIGDEPTTGLDVMVKSQILGLLERLSQENNMGMIIITHDLSVVVEICEKVAVMYAGKIVEYGDTEAIFEKPAHPYTKALIEAFPNIYGERILTSSIPGSPPNLLNPPSGCRFHPRCSYASKKCKEEEHILVKVEDNHYSACPLFTSKSPKTGIVVV
jgi:oligopeptide/dipeptide ABC transporter ATP-binding protein